MQEQRDLQATIELIQKLELSKKQRRVNFVRSLFARSLLLLPLHIIGYWIIQRHDANMAREFLPILFGCYSGAFFVAMLAARLDSTLPREQFKPLYTILILVPLILLIHWLLLGVIAWYWQLCILYIFGPNLSISLRRYPRCKKYPEEYEIIELLTGKRKYKLTEDQFKLAAHYEPINFERAPTKRDPAW